MDMDMDINLISVLSERGGVGGYIDTSIHRLSIGLSHNLR